MTASLLEALYNAPKDESHPYHKYEHPALWEDVRKAMGKVDKSNRSASVENLEEKIQQGWVGQLAGGSFGTAIEGYTGTNIASVYGEITSYITQPETMNDDLVYELILLDVFEKMGRKLTSRELGLEWVKQLPFAWSAEWIALENLRAGYFPPESATRRNPYSNWIGAQMRGMICGMLAPAWPMEAARLAHIDGVVSHSANGVYGEIFAGVMTALAFVESDPRKLIMMTREYIPAKSEYMQILDDTLKFIEESANIEEVLAAFDDYFKTYNWIHAYPNLGADVFALWFGEGDMTKSFSLLAKAGMDVDCNGGLVGNVLGIINGVPKEWADPIGDLLETYLPGKERMSIKELAQQTARLSRVKE